MPIWNFIVEYRIDLGIGAAFALLFALLFDFIQPTSRIRTVVGFIKNKMADRSVARLQARIEELERYRGRLVAYLASDKSHYLAVLQLILGVMALMCLGAAVAMLESLGLIAESFKLVALAPILIALVVAVGGVQTASWDTGPKISEVLSKVEAQIGELKAKLNARTQRF